MNKQIIMSTLVIGASGVVSAWNSSRPITPVVLGAYVFMLTLSIADMFGGYVSQIAGGIAMVAAIAVLLNEFPWGTVIQVVQGKKA